ncbi:hypothetical protein QAD02_006347 [Eretmocerus hayati]|uniref:Uncharacterized protein n=1 Tax=Eretmocerus hayati TaxID=131215 RepID=A0ACC2N0L9_9HYME|nr:hypothetical protein QAD02_006347 [Eretmocerus hayati]
MQRKLSSRQLYGLKTYTHLKINKRHTYMGNRTCIKILKQWAEHRQGNNIVSRAWAWVKSRSSQNQAKMSGDQDLVNSLEGAFTQDEEIVIQQICALPNIEMTVGGQITSEQESEASQQWGSEVLRETGIAEDVNNEHDRRIQEIMRELVNSSEGSGALNSTEWLSQFDLSPITPNVSTKTDYKGCGHSRDNESSAAPQYELLGNQESVSDNTLKSVNTTDAFQYYEYVTSSNYMIHGSNNETHTPVLPCYNESNIWRPIQLSTGEKDAISAPIDRCEYNITEKIDEYKAEATSYVTDNAEGRDITSNEHVFNLYGTTVTSGTENIRRNTQKQNAQLVTKGKDIILEVHSVGVTRRSSVTHESDTQPPGANPSTSADIGSSDTNADGALATAINLGSDTPPAHHEVPSAASQSNNTDDSRPKRKRYSTRTYQDTNSCNSRDKTVRTRYPDICKLREQAKNNCPDLDHPFWENIENFSCKRSVFYRKDRSGIICHLSYFKEKHEPMGFVIDSKHILIKSNRNPQMPTCLECHNNYCEVKEAVKCEYCVKAYFELMLESEQGERKEIIDKWD